MGKKKVSDLRGAKNLLFPYLPVIVGANVDGKPNYITIGLVGWLCYDAMSVSVGHKQYTNAGIKESRTFSINQPTAGMVKELDYCGLYSGRKVDKSILFENFYGELQTAPMIKECPVNIECRVVQIMERSIHTVFIGEVAAVYLDEECLTQGVLDISKVDPVFFAPDKKQGKYSGSYWRLGEYLARAWEVGKDLRDDKEDQAVS
ncbi:MAG: flavin reductase family protein [Candidatus Zixiibacteriota bacterium]